MAKLVITLKKIEVDAHIEMLGKLVEGANPKELGTYEEVCDLMGVSDIPGTRSEFIERIAREVASQNHSEENRIRQKRKGKMKKLIIVSII